jgi:hypothetical protein
VSTAGEPTGAPLPAGLLIGGDPAALAPVFPALVALQPVAWTPFGLVCAPRAGGDAAAAALAACPVPVRALPAVPGWPEPPAVMLAGWYLRGPGHAAAPPGVRELVQVPGEGFGPGAHPTTAMCLAALRDLPPAPAVDLGCGSGLLAQAWAALGRGTVRGVDLDPRAVAQARESVRAAGLAGSVHLECAPAAAVADALPGAVLLANLPLSGHRSMLACMHTPPVAAVLSGLRPTGAREVVGAYRAGGGGAGGAPRPRRWERWVLRGPGAGAGTE